MREEPGTNRDTAHNTSGSVGRMNAPARPRQPAFPYSVLRGTPGQGEHHVRGGNAAKKPVARSAGRTGVDLRAAAGGALRQPPASAPQAAPAKRGVPWRRDMRNRPVATADTVTVPRQAITRSRRRIHIHYSLVLLALAQIAVLGLIAWALTSPTWQVRYVEVTGTQDATLTAAIQKLPLTGCNIFRCDMAREARLVETLPAVASADVHAAYPDGLTIVVTARQPALLWRASGQDVVVARDGTVLGPPTSDPVYTRAALPQIEDDASTAFGGRTPQAGAKMPAIIVEMASQLRNSMGTALGASGWTLRYSAESGFVAVGPAGEQVMFGTPSDAASLVATSPSPATLGSEPNSATVDAGVRAQLAEMRSLNTLLARQHQKPSVVDLRWGTHPYFRTGN